MINDFYLEFSKIILNFIIFVSLQTLFFYFVVSRFSLTIFNKKIKLYTDFFKQNIPSSDLLALKNFLINDIEQNSSSIQQLADQRNIENINFLFFGVAPIIIISFILFFLLILKSSIKPDLNYLKILIIIFFSYSTEIAFYFIVMNRYEFIGTTPGIFKNILIS